ncbi:hypothetical protein ACJMK2_018354 [Sinanodonta woodiana]|uniref:Multidrug resistance-associated protein 4 n=1 Tax=Sinanodonta woodiana TaxID=1069815 RepID=A0ABD3UFX0_SINWO
MVIFRTEYKFLWRGKMILSFTNQQFDMFPRLMYFGFFVPAAFTGFDFRAASLFICLPYVTYLAQKPFFRTIMTIADTCVSSRRIQTFLMLDELESESGTKLASTLRPKPEECCVTITDVTAKWDKKLQQTTLENISASVKAGQLVAVIGPVGAGKSSLLMTVLKELSVIDGSIQVKGCIAYASQQPWVFSASLRQNITFGNLYKKSKYDQILKACALNKDIELMPNGDLTLIGDRGVSLSGGQRARVSLARALYMDADVYLLDDPLSAVDATVGKHLFERVIQGMLKDKPRILVTHQLQFLKAADQILILKEGKMIGKGTFDELSTSGVDFSSLLKRDKEEEEKKEVDLMKQHSNMNLRRRLDSTRSGREVSPHEVGSKMSLASIGTEFEAEEVQLPEEEERHKGTISFGIYVEYFKAGAGILKFILLVFLCLAAQGSYIMSDWWLSRWSNQEEAKHAARDRDSHLRQQGHNETNITIPHVDTHLNIGVFSGIIGSVFFFGLLRALIFFKVAVDASKTLHNQMFEKILRTQIGFFDSNPCFLLIIGIVIVAGVINPWVFIPTVPLSVLFLVIRRYYLHTSRHIKRLEGTTRSPVFSHLSASLQGLHTIRAFNMQDKFVEEFDNHQDLHSESWFLFLTSSRWLAIRLDWLCALFVTAVSVSCVLAAESLNAGLVGLSMTYAMTLMGMFQWGVRQSAEVENQMVSVERVLDYSNLPSEAPLESIDSKKPPPDWPTEGVIIGKGAGLRYGDDKPLVLKDLNFVINGKEKVGIVGRTGAGKSSLITMLFRLVEPCSGELVIDGINILETGLHDLRNKISIIPQDPVLFTGTLRRNLDPFSNHQDIALWNALKEVQLKDAIEELPRGLETEVSEGGINFSVGQRQLICLARAILRQNKILMIDEATANVDPRTDQLIQKTIREKFRNCTVLTIAHRLNTIMDSDRVLVLDEGRIVEFDHPHLLLLNPNGIFYKMVHQTGKSEKDHLLEIAKSAFVKISSQSKTANRDETSSDISPEVSSLDKESELFLTLPKISESNISLCGSSIMDETGSIRSSEVQSQDGMFHSPVKSFLSDGTEDKKDENTDDLVDNRSGIVIKLKDVCDRMDGSVNSTYEILSIPNGNNDAELDKPKIAPKENIFSSAPLSVGTYKSDLDEDDDSEKEIDESKELLEKSDGYSHNVEPNQAVTAEERIFQDHSNAETTSLLIQE